MKAPLPTVDGIGPSRITLPEGKWKSILEFLIEHFPDVQPSAWISRMDEGKVLDENGIVLTMESPYRRGARIFYYRELEKEPPIPFEEEILYHDNNLIVTDKPHFLPVVPSGRFLRETLLVRLKRKLNLGELVPVHRIDRDTAGIVVFSCNTATRGDYALLFQKRSVEKVYEALAPTLSGAHFPIRYQSCIARGEPFFRMKEIKGKPNSETLIDVLEEKGDCTLYRLRPLTGRKHQIRLHLAALGIAIINDRLYPDLLPHKEDDFSQPLKLLARSVSFDDPLTGQHRQFKSNRTLLH